MESLMRPYSLDLRARIVQAHKMGNVSPVQIAERFGVCLATVYNYLKRDRTCKDLRPKHRTPSTRRPTNDPQVRMTVTTLVEEQRDATLVELCDRLAQRIGVRISVSTMSLLLRALRFRKKKDGTRYRERTRSRASRP